MNIPTMCRIVVPATVATLCACGGSGQGGRDGGPDAPVGDAAVDGAGGGLSRAELLGAFGACLLETADRFGAQAEALEAATTALRDAPDAASRQAARDAYATALAAWQTAEPMQVGPAAPSMFAGGQDLRDQIYSWPLVGRCAVEEQIVKKGYEAPDFGNALFNRRTLTALEYLLFYEGDDTACAASHEIVASGSWAALPADEREARKRAYAAVVAGDVRRRADTLIAAWRVDGGNFVATLAGAGAGNAVYPTTQAALNAVSDALFYLEEAVKDMKVARPLGLRDCETMTCPEVIESRISRLSKANVAANVVGFRKLMEGCGDAFAGLGFDDLLRAIGAGEVATRVGERTADVETALAAINEADLESALKDDAPSVRALYDALKALTDLLKTEFVTVLDLELPQSVEGDND